MSLNHLCQASRGVISNTEIMSQMLDDWSSIDRDTIIKQCRYAVGREEMMNVLDKVTICTFSFSVQLSVTLSSTKAAGLFTLYCGS